MPRICPPELKEEIRAYLHSSEGRAELLGIVAQEFERLPVAKATPTASRKDVVEWMRAHGWEVHLPEHERFDEADRFTTQPRKGPAFHGYRY